MSDHDSESVHPNDSDAWAIANRVTELVTDRPIDDRFRMLSEISSFTAQAYGDRLPPSFFVEALHDPSLYKPLLENPAAGPLLAYIVHALLHYNAINSDLPDTTAGRRAVLSDIFALTGTKGERWLPIATREGIAARFAFQFQAALRADSGDDEEPSARTKARAKNAALRNVYEWHFAESYVTDSEKHKERMADLRAIIREALPRLVSRG